MKYAIKWLAIMAMVASGGLSGQTRADEGLYSSVELLFLSPKLNAVGFNNIFYLESPAVPQSVDGKTGSDLEFAQRVIVGYEGDEGGGVQVRWFTYDNDAGYIGSGNDSVNGNIPIIGQLNFDLDAIDAELTQRGKFRVWDWLATAGARYARVDIHNSSSGAFDWTGFNDAAWFGLAGMEFEGAGPTVSVQGSREILWEGFEFFGNARTALLYGDLEVDSIFRVNGGPIVISDVFAQVWEVQVGVRMEHEFDVFDLVCGIFWEAQRWENDSNIGDFALHGFGVKTGFEY